MFYNDYQYVQENNLKMGFGKAIWAGIWADEILVHVFLINQTDLRLEFKYLEKEGLYTPKKVFL